ncbi:hypothetical protein ACFDTO_32720 [Microbacteriaceae bacterium 4G12]
MEKAVRYLITINILNYVNNFLFAYVNSFVTLKGPVAMWAVLPWLFLTLSSFILATDNKEEYKVFKKEAITDYVIRVMAFAVAFFNQKFEIFSFEYIMRFVLLIILFAISMLLEYKMYQKAKRYIPSTPKSKIENVSEAEKRNIRYMGRAVTLGVTSFLIVCGVGMNIALLANIHKYYIAISITVFIIFLHMNYTKVDLFYLNKALRNRIFIRDSIYACLGFIFNLLIALGIFSFGDGGSTFGIMIAVCSLYPTIRTNRKMALRQKQVVAILGDDFDYYYNLKKE